LKPGAFVYTAPDSLEEAIELLGEHGAEAKPLAGGQSLMPLLNMRFAQPAVLVDLNAVPGLDSIARRDAQLEIGASVRQASFGASPLVREHIPAAATAVPYIGHFVTRNRGTVGGSLAHADARGELPLALVALGGSVRVVSRRNGERMVSADELFVTHFTTSLSDEELLVSSIWPIATNGWHFAFEEFAQRHGDYALGMVCVGVRVSGGRVSDARVAVSAVTDRPVCLTDAGAVLIGHSPAPDAAREAGAMAAAAVDPHSDFHASAPYRRHLTGVLVERACLTAFAAAS
jgi:CO/xanthine dehydrogenase FAD-binding subunit